MTPATRILVVGASCDSDALAELLRFEGYDVELVPRSQVSAVARACQPDLVIADVAFPQTEGLALLQQLQRAGRPLRTILLSSRPSTALEPYGVTCLAKPVDLTTLWRLLGHAPARA